MYELDVRTKLSDLEERYVHAMLRRVTDQAPYIASCQASVEEIRKNDTAEEKDYRVQVEIRSPVGFFFGTGVSDDFREAVDKAEQQIQKDIEGWRSNRFRDQMIDTYSSVA